MGLLFGPCEFRNLWLPEIPKIQDLANSLLLSIKFAVNAAALNLHFCNTDFKYRILDSWWPFFGVFFMMVMMTLMAFMMVTFMVMTMILMMMLVAMVMTT